MLYTGYDIFQNIAEHVTNDSFSDISPLAKTCKKLSQWSKLDHIWKSLYVKYIFIELNFGKGYYNKFKLSYTILFPEKGYILEVFNNIHDRVFTLGFDIFDISEVYQRIIDKYKSEKYPQLNIYINFVHTCYIEEQPKYMIYRDEIFHKGDEYYNVFKLQLYNINIDDLKIVVRHRNFRLNPVPVYRNLLRPNNKTLRCNYWCDRLVETFSKNHRKYLTLLCRQLGETSPF